MPGEPTTMQWTAVEQVIVWRMRSNGTPCSRALVFNKMRQLWPPSLVPKTTPRVSGLRQPDMRQPDADAKQTLALVQAMP
jgi:hypothetical protein